jgi:hypothetical protein
VDRRERNRLIGLVWLDARPEQPATPVRLGSRRRADPDVPGGATSSLSINTSRVPVPEDLGGASSRHEANLIAIGRRRGVQPGVANARPGGATTLPWRTLITE